MMKRILIVAAFSLITILPSCTALEFGSSINDIIGTEWSYQDEDGTMGLKFYANNQVTSFLDNKYGVETLNGTYEYIASSKTLSFTGLTWYYSDTGKEAFTMNGAHIKDNKTMELVIKMPEGGIEHGYFYRK